MPRLFLPVLILSLSVSFFRLGAVPLFDVDEGVFATATREMVQSGDWITPTYNGVVRYDKPILFYWLMAVPYKFFGIHEFSARFPSALAATILAPVLFLFIRRFRDDREAFGGAITLVLSAYFFVYSHAAVTDMSLALFTGLSLMAFFRSVAVHEHEDRYRAAFYVFSALAFLTKGLIGVLFPFGIVIVYQVAVQGWKGLERIWSPIGAALFLVVALPWYAAQLMINGKEFIDQFFIKHHFLRYTGVISGHRGPVYYYLPALVIGLFPWIAFLPSGIAQAWTDWKVIRKERGSAGHSVRLFALIWAAFIVLFFSFSTTKLPNYILPALPAVALLVSSGMNTGERSRKYSLMSVAFLAVLSGGGILFARTYLVKSGVQDTEWIIFSGLILFVIAAGAVSAMKFRRALLPALGVPMALFLLVLSVKAVPLAGEKLQGTLYRYSLEAKGRLGEGGRLVAFGINNPSVLFYTGQGGGKAIITRNREELLPHLREGADLVAISRSKDAALLMGLGFRVLGEEGKYAILEKKAGNGQAGK